MHYKTPITFSFIFFLLIVNTLIFLFSDVFLKTYLYALPVALIFNLFFLSSIRKIEILNNAVKISNLFMNKEYFINHIEYVEVFYKSYKYSRPTLIFKIENKKILFDFPDYKITKVEGLIQILNEKKVPIHINSDLAIHQRLKKYS